MISFIFLILAGIVGGILENSVGIASLAVYPAMLMVGVPPILANVTNTIGFAFSDSSAILASQPELKGQSKKITKVLLCTVPGTIIGSFIIIHSSNGSFQEIAPFIILLAGVLILLPQKKIGVKKTRNIFMEFLISILMFLVGIYLGYFGAGAGVVLMALLLIDFNESYATSNAIRNFVSFALNWISAIIFMLTITINWVALIAISIGLLFGGYMGPLVVRRVPSKIMKLVVAICSIVLAIVLELQILI